MGKKKKKGRNRYSSLNTHKRHKSTLKPPLSTLNLDLINWEADLLPEHLWIDLLADEYEKLDWAKIYNDFLDKLENEIAEKIFLYGFLTDFGVIPLQSRKSFIEKNKDFIYKAFYKPIGKILSLYPDNPANWLILEEFKDKEKIEFESELKKLDRSVKRLYRAKDLYAGHIRAIPLNRLFIHQRLFYSEGMSVTELIGKYPGGCTEEEKYHVQSHARMTMNMEYMREERYKSRAWPKYFWRHNYDLVPCIPSEFKFSDEQKITDDQYKDILKNIDDNCQVVTKYITKLAIQYKYDLYETTKDEILLGLFSRITRLFVSYVNDPNLWARDLSGIMLRCIVETGIIFSFLVNHGSDEDFSKFKKYGEGKEKLLMLHLQDSFKNSKAVDDKSFEDIEIDLGGGINPELIEIELSDWTKKSTRDLAIQSGFEDLYKLVYDPSSSDVHGTWTSLKSSNLSYCNQSLHRFHKLPSFVEPPLFMNNINIVYDVYNRCYNIGSKKLDFPKLEGEIKKINLKNKG